MLEHMMVNAGEVVIDIAFQAIRFLSSIAPKHPFSCFDTCKCPLSIPACVGMEKESTLEDWSDDIADGMMQHSVFERCRHDDAMLRLFDAKRIVYARLVRLIDELILQFDEVLF